MVKQTINNQTQWDKYINSLEMVDGFKVIPEGDEIIIKTNIIISHNMRCKGTITNNKGGTITNDNKIENYKTINNDGNITNNSIINNYHTIENDGTIENGGVIEIKQGSINGKPIKNTGNPLGTVLDHNRVQQLEKQLAERDLFTKAMIGSWQQEKEYLIKIIKEVIGDKTK